MNPHTALNDVSATPRTSTNQPQTPAPASRMPRITLHTHVGGTRDTIRHTATHTISNDMMDGIHALIDCDRVWVIHTDNNVDELDAMQTDLIGYRTLVEVLKSTIKDKQEIIVALRTDVANRDKHLAKNENLLAEYRERARNNEKTIDLMRATCAGARDTIAEYAHRETLIKDIVEA